MDTFEERTKAMGTLTHVSWEYAAFAIMKKLDELEERKLLWTTQELTILFVNLRLVDMQFTLTESVCEVIATDEASKLLASNTHYRTIQKIIEKVIER